MESALKYFRKRCEHLKMCLDTSLDKERLEAVIKHNEKAVEALEKRTPKKIVHNPEAGREAGWTCPDCERTCIPYARHCQNCGQVLYSEKHEKD